MLSGKSVRPGLRASDGCTRKDYNMQNKISIGVAGAGAMGTGIAHLAAQQGFRVMLYDVHPAALSKSRALIDQLGASSIRKGRISQAQHEEILGRIQFSEQMESLQASDIVIECVAEVLEVKLDLFSRLDALLGEQAFLVSNTSSMSITKLAAATGRPGKVAGFHFFNPAQVMKLVEIVKAQQTLDSTVDFLRQLAQALGKVSIVVLRDSPGFVVNRLLLPQMREAVKLLEEGVASMEDIDTALKYGLNHPMGIFALQDLTGIDICCQVLAYFREEMGDQYAPPLLMKQMVAAGKLGRKTGLGWYDYTETNEGKGKDT